MQEESAHTPTPPQLLTVESSQLFKPIMQPDMNTTFDKEEGKIFFPLQHFGAQSFTSLMADLHQDII